MSEYLTKGFVPVCRECGSSDLSFDLPAKWNPVTGRFVCLDEPENGSVALCGDCGEESSGIDEFVPYDPAVHDLPKEPSE